LPKARALVTEHGGAHSHGATLAREYGIPAVLGVRVIESKAEGAEIVAQPAAEEPTKVVDLMAALEASLAAAKANRSAEAAEG
jgi:phosphoenolpyruvate-protein kinase (PTS system EI component)